MIFVLALDGGHMVSVHIFVRSFRHDDVTLLSKLARQKGKTTEVKEGKKLEQRRDELNSRRR